MHLLVITSFEHLAVQIVVSATVGRIDNIADDFECGAIVFGDITDRSSMANCCAVAKKRSPS